MLQQADSLDLADHVRSSFLAYECGTDESSNRPACRSRYLENGTTRIRNAVAKKSGRAQTLPLITRGVVADMRIIACVALLLLVHCADLPGAWAEEPAQFGAIGDGRPHAIGAAYGTTLRALAGYAARAGAHPFGWVLDPAYGLTFQRTTSAAQKEPGTMLSVTTLARPVDAAAQIVIPGMIASAACLLQDDTVRRVDTLGSVELAQPSRVACPAGSRITFTLAPAQIQALQADWLGIQAAIAATHARPTGGSVHIPSGDYVVDRPLVNPGGIRDTGFVVPQVDEYGDGLAQTRITFTTDLGPGTCGLGETDRGIGSTTRARIRDLRLVGPSRGGTLGKPPAAMDGFCIGAKEMLRRVRADFFHAGVNVLEDHWEIQDSEFSGNLYGVYLAAGGDTFGNGVLRDVYPGGSLLASIAVAAGSVLDSATLQNVHLGFAPYGFYREHAPPGSPAPLAFISNSLLENIWGEALGNGYIHGENGVGDVVVRNTWINTSPVMDLTGEYRIRDRPVEAVIQVGAFVDNDMIGSDFGNPNNYAMAARAVIAASANIQGNDFGRSPDLVAGSSSAKPALRAPVVLFNRFATGQAEGRFLTALSAVDVGQVMAEAGGDRTGPAAPGLPLAGVAMAAADAGAVVPVGNRGIVRVTKKAIPLRSGQAVGLVPGDPTRVDASAHDTASLGTVWQDVGADAPMAIIVLGLSNR